VEGPPATPLKMGRKGWIDSFVFITDHGLGARDCSFRVPWHPFKPQSVMMAEIPPDCGKYRNAILKTRHLAPDNSDSSLHSFILFF
jgi:hypothetical protein